MAGSGSQRSRTFVAPPQGEHDTRAIAAVALGTTALLFVLLSAGLLSLVTLPLAVAGDVIARKARDERMLDGAPRRGLAHAGLVICRISAVLSFCALVAWTVLIATGSDLLDDLEDWLEDVGEEEGDPGREPGPDDIVVQVRLVAGVLRLALLHVG